MKKILIGTHNQGKFKEIAYLISKNYKKISPISLKIKSPRETGKTFVSNSKLKTKFDFKDKKLLFLLTINIVPILLMFLTSMIMGVKIRTMWMTPFYLFFGVLLVYIFQSQINLNKLKGFVSVFIILFILSPFAYAYVSITQTDKRTDYPGKEIAQKVQLEWNKNFEDSINVVLGNGWDAGN